MTSSANKTAFFIILLAGVQITISVYAYATQSKHLEGTAKAFWRLGQDELMNIYWIDLCASCVLLLQLGCFLEIELELTQFAVRAFTKTFLAWFILGCCFFVYRLVGISCDFVHGVPWDQAILYTVATAVFGTQIILVFLYWAGLRMEDKIVDHNKTQAHACTDVKSVKY